MGKLPYTYTDSEETERSENTEGSLDNLKKKRKPSILKYTAGNIKKKKCTIHSKSEPDDSDIRSKNGSRTSYKESRKKLKGILKMDRERDRLERERERYRDASTDEESEPEPAKKQSIHRYLVGRVPRPSGSKPGRGGGVAIIVKKNIKNANSLPAPQTSTSNTKKSKNKRRSY